MNLGMMLAQYLIPMLIFAAVTAIFLGPRFGVGFHRLIALIAIWFFDSLSCIVIPEEIILCGVSFPPGRTCEDTN